MKENPSTGALAPFNFAQIENEVPELRNFRHELHCESLLPLVDSSDVTPDFWVRLVQLIVRHYDAYDGFVVLHGTDTMAYTASALSFMLPDLSKPIVLTGSQLPIGAIRTDGKENILGAIEIAAESLGGRARVPEVTVFFNHTLMRGNRTTKFGAERFDAFRSFNYPPLAEAGITIRYNDAAIRQPAACSPVPRLRFETNVASLRLYPGLSHCVVERLVTIPNLRGLVLETYGAGNAPSDPRLTSMLAEAVRQGVVVINITQCPADSVSMTTYETGLGLARAGVVGGGNMTFEAAVVKLMLALGENTDSQAAIDYFSSDIAGEKVGNDCHFKD